MALWSNYYRPHARAFIRSAVPSDLVAVQGMGGLGHLGVQFAKKCGYRVAAVGRGAGNLFAS